MRKLTLAAIAAIPLAAAAMTRGTDLLGALSLNGGIKWR